MKDIIKLKNGDDLPVEISDRWSWSDKRLNEHREKLKEASKGAPTTSLKEFMRHVNEILNGK